MIKLIKLGNYIYENIEPKYIDENGNEIWNVPNDFNQLTQAFVDTLVWLAKQRVHRVLEEYGYYSLGDVQFYASQNDVEAKAILGWYQAYDTAIWDYIAQNFDPIINGTQQATVGQLLQNYSDLRAVEEEIFNQSVQTSPLP